MRRNDERKIPWLVVLLTLAACGDDGDQLGSPATATDGGSERPAARLDGAPPARDARPDEIWPRVDVAVDPRRDAAPSLEDGATDAALAGHLGRPCSEQNLCPEGLVCLLPHQGTVGFCSATCSEPGGACPVAPDEQSYGCLHATDDGSTYFCGFVCRFGNESYPCPHPSMRCGDTPAPPDSPQYLCEPRAVCSDGEIAPCDDVGACQSGTRTCQQGQFGPCQWAQGPASEICDGVDNDCDGQVDEALDDGPGCAKQSGVCQGARMRCGGSAGWRPCSDADYQGHATGGTPYQTTETICDGVDNDCNGQVDEAPQCCEPDCSGATCGGPDGCGGICAAGSCPVGQHCDGGVCACSHLSCDGQCCAPGEVCSGGACCLASCSGQACGAPDGCGGTCNSGTCPGGQRCVGGICRCETPCGGTCCGTGQTCYLGQCCAPRCSGQPCGAPDGCGGLCPSGICPDHSSCRQGSCVCDHATCEGGCCPASYDYCRSQSPGSSSLYCATTCAPDGYGCERSSDCCPGLSCRYGSCA